MSRPPDTRMLTGEEAANYCGFKSVNGFVAHIPVAPVNFGRLVRYDRKALDEAMDSLGQSTPMVSLSERVGNADNDHGA